MSRFFVVHCVIIITSSKNLVGECTVKSIFFALVTDVDARYQSPSFSLHKCNEGGERGTQWHNDVVSVLKLRECVAAL